MSFRSLIRGLPPSRSLQGHTSTESNAQSLLAASVAAQIVQQLVEVFQLILREAIDLGVLGIDSARVDLGFEAGHDTKVVSGALHGPEQVWVGLV